MKSSRQRDGGGLGVLILLGCLAATTAQGGYVPSNITPPAPPREFRGAWIATVKNIDWPSRPGLTTQQQQAELTAILDRAVQLRLNTVILQVRPSCDALYASKLEPWSEYLTGKMGQAPVPLYDPLEFAVGEAHRRGLELHAWFNPYRARLETSVTPAAKNHLSRTQPRLVKTYGQTLWLDPGEPAVRDHSRQVILDVVRRYDIDGVHLDDYFYPYPVKDAAGRVVDFPDWTSWKHYLGTGGKMSKGDWRRANVDGFIESLYHAIKQAKPAVKFGISPFGIWRPGQPASIRGTDAYEQLYADSRRWLLNGWVDYFSPQLYWRIDPPEQSFPVLLKWWAEQNRHNRHLWPGMSVSRLSLGWPVEEFINQVRRTRQQPGATGNVLWSVKVLMANRAGISDTLARDVYAQPALVPASPWLDATPPSGAKLSAAADTTTGGARAAWEPVGNEPVWLWVLQSRQGNSWTTEILPGRETRRLLSGPARPEAIAVTAVDRCGNASTPTVLAWEPTR